MAHVGVIDQQLVNMLILKRGRLIGSSSSMVEGRNQFQTLTWYPLCGPVMKQQTIVLFFSVQ